MESKPGRLLIITGIIFMVIALFVRLPIAANWDTTTSVTALKVSVFTQVLLAVGCLCVGGGMLRRTEGFGEPVVRAAYVIGAAALFIAVLMRSV